MSDDRDPLNHEARINVLVVYGTSREAAVAIINLEDRLDAAERVISELVTGDTP